MRVLVACEFSGVVRDAFILRGHDAISCDLLPTESPGPHYQGDIRDMLSEKWDLMIAHPPCTYLTNAGNRWFFWNGRGSRPYAKRWRLMYEAADFFKMLLHADVPRVAVENPARMFSSVPIRLPDQVIQPWEFGHKETKATGLWLRGLPKLKPTKVMYGVRVPFTDDLFLTLSNKRDLSHERSRTYPGIARAMAKQWGIACTPQQGIATPRDPR